MKMRLLLCDNRNNRIFSCVFKGMYRLNFFILCTIIRKKSIKTVFHCAHFTNKWTVFSLPDEIFFLKYTTHKVTLIALLYLFYWWSEVCQTFHLKPLFSGGYEQMVEKTITSQKLGTHDLGSV